MPLLSLMPLYKPRFAVLNEEPSSVPDSATRSKRRAPDGSQVPYPNLSKRNKKDLVRRVFLAPFSEDIFCIDSSTIEDKFFLDHSGQASSLNKEDGAMEDQDFLREESREATKTLFGVRGNFYSISEFHRKQLEKLEQDSLISSEKMPNEYWDEIYNIDIEEKKVIELKEKYEEGKKAILEQKRIAEDEYEKKKRKILSDYDQNIKYLKKRENEIKDSLNADKMEKERYFEVQEDKVRANIAKVNKDYQDLQKKTRFNYSGHREDFDVKFANQQEILLKDIDKETESWFQQEQKKLDDEFENQQKKLDDEFKKNIAIVCVPSQPLRPFAFPPMPIIMEQKHQIMAKLKLIVTDPVFVKFFEEKGVYKTVSSSIAIAGGERRNSINFKDFTDDELEGFAKEFLKKQEDKIIKSFVRILKDGKDAINYFLGQEEGLSMLKDFFLKITYEDNTEKSKFRIKDKKISFFNILGFFIDSDFSFKDLNTRNLIKSAIYHNSAKFMNKIIESDPDFFKNRSNVIKHIFESAKKGSPTLFSSLFLATDGCLNINEKDKNGNTVLNSVNYVGRSKKSMVSYLLLLGADPLIANNVGELPIDRVPEGENEVKKLFEEYEKCARSQPKVGEEEGVIGGEGGIEGEGVIEGEGGIEGEGFPQASMERIRKKQLDEEKDRINKQLERIKATTRQEFLERKSSLQKQKIYKIEKLVSGLKAKKSQELEAYLRDNSLTTQQINEEKAQKLEQIEAVKNQIESDKAIFLQQTNQREINELQPIQKQITSQEQKKDEELSFIESKKTETLSFISSEECALTLEGNKIKDSEVDLQIRRKQVAENYKKAKEKTKAQLISDKEMLVAVRSWESMPCGSSKSKS